MTLSNPVNMTILESATTSTLIITDDDDAPSLSINDVTTSNENAANATFTATLSAASGKEVTVNYASSNGTATAGADYTASSGTLTFAAGTTTQTFTVPVLADSLDEANETATLTLSNASNASISDATGTLTITDDDGFETALIFDGSNDHLEIADNNLLDLTGDYTLEAWIRPDTVSTHGIFSKWVAGTWPPNYWFHLAGGDVDFYNGRTIRGPAIDANTWTHVAVTVDASDKQKLYIDGSYSGYQTNAGSSPANAGKLYIGYRGDAYRFDGMMDEVRIWNDVRTATEISDNYKTPLSGSEANLVAYYKFDDNLNDSSGNNLHGTASGDIGTYSESTAAAGDPLVFDLDGDGVELLGLDAGVTFDLFGSPVRENTGWVGPSDALLAMDLDGSGAIESLTEIFSDRFGGVSFPSSLDALRSLDTNADGMIDASDPSFGDILLWQDANSDGLSSEEELRTLIDHGIVAIDLDADENSELVMGNRIDATGRFQFLDGSSGTYSQV